jgi:membrane protease subunit HflK
MPWNEPGGNNHNKDPWGGGKREQGPPDLDKFFSDLFKKLKSVLYGKKNGRLGEGPSWPSGKENSRFLLGIGFAMVLLVWFLSGLFIVNPAEEAVILRFGKYADELPPGLHWFARFIDTKYLVDVQKIYSFSLQGDFLTKSSDQDDVSTQYVSVNAEKQGNVADQSKNLVNVELSVQYRVTNPKLYLFNVVDPDETIKEVASGALSDIVGQMKLDDVLTTGRETLSSGVLNRIKQILGPYQTGLDVIAVTLKKVQAPDQVREAFNDVNRAEQDRSTYTQQAQAYASKVVPLAQGVAARISANATAYQQQVVLKAQADVAKFEALFNVYSISPAVTRERMYLEAMQTILQNTSKVLVDGNNNSNLLYLPLDKLIRTTQNKNISNDSNTDLANVSSSTSSSPSMGSQNDMLSQINMPVNGEAR